ncbi:hypothetical protein [Zunongwangia pacifica]|uniref:Uncharacterized protein n=1 Tax=Zunongwangia pacifica TaxID=2911062 RepID=A0A9X1ZV60_9FLAO|nr:hypothetical protein [Zunongwangia pacifica]MCL6219790.1 hypothetical protein [Zunongwangia pacifica]
MKQRYYFIFIVIFFSIGWKETNQVRKQNLTDYSLKKIENLGKLQEDTSAIDTLINDDFVHSCIKGMFVKARDKSFRKVMIFVENKHNKDITDTVINLSFKLDEIVIYSSKNNKILRSARIKNDGSELNNIRIGMKLSNFKDILGEDISNQIELLTVSNLEQTNRFDFQFRNKILAEINYDGYLD